MLNVTPNSLLSPRPPSVGKIENEMRLLPHLAGDRGHLTQGTKRDFKDARKCKHASEAIGRLPAPDEALHLVVSGRFALWHTIPAVLALSGTRIAELTIATLGFSKQNIAALCDLLDINRISRVRLLASHYFKGTSATIYQFAQEQFEKRPEKTSFLSVRNHAKLVLMKLIDGRTVAVESSANLRSNKNCETMTVLGDPRVYAFHKQWIDELFTAANVK
jgi:hypothetical protein